MRVPAARRKLQPGHAQRAELAMIRGHLDVLQADFRPWWIVGAVR
jgi:hypothetical protein